jgi:hypothetical protein
MKWTKTGNLLAAQINETLSYDETLGRTNLFTNGDFEFGNNYNFSGSVSSVDPHSGSYHLIQNNTAQWQSSEMVPVDTSKEYQLSVWVKTLERSAAGSLAGGHLGFACYDSSFRFIDLRNCGGRGNTVLTRAARPGDTVIYIESSSDWYVGDDVTGYTYYYRHVQMFPESHPEYNQPWRYTRIGYGDYNIIYRGLVQVRDNEWQMTLESPLPNIGYELPAGTPISRGVAGGTYNYALGAPWYPEEWTNFKTTIPAGVESLNSGNQFRYNTAYIRFLILGNYNIRSQSAPYATFALDDIAFACTSEFQGNNSSEALKAKKGIDGTIYAQEFNELKTGPNNGKLGGLNKSGEFTVNGEIIEE